MGQIIEFKVYGTPGPQGSKRFVGGGRMIESSAKVKPWREAVKWAAREAMEPAELSISRHCNGAIVGAIALEVTFTLPKPKSAKRGAVPSKKPDLDKLIRSTSDAITDAGAWEDDGRVVSIVAHKRYPNEGADALDAPGAVIRIKEAA